MLVLDAHDGVVLPAAGLSKNDISVLVGIIVSTDPNTREGWWDDTPAMSPQINPVSPTSRNIGGGDSLIVSSPVAGYSISFPRNSLLKKDVVSVGVQRFSEVMPRPSGFLHAGDVVVLTIASGQIPVVSPVVSAGVYRLMRPEGSVRSVSADVQSEVNIARGARAGVSKISRVDDLVGVVSTTEGSEADTVRRARLASSARVKDGRRGGSERHPPLDGPNGQGQDTQGVTGVHMKFDRRMQEVPAHGFVPEGSALHIGFDGLRPGSDGDPGVGAMGLRKHEGGRVLKLFWLNTQSAKWVLIGQSNYVLTDGGSVQGVVSLDIFSTEGYSGIFVAFSITEITFEELLSEQEAAAATTPAPQAPSATSTPQPSGTLVDVRDDGDDLFLQIVIPVAVGSFALAGLGLLLWARFHCWKKSLTIPVADMAVGQLPSYPPVCSSSNFILHIFLSVFSSLSVTRSARRTFITRD